MNDVIRDYQRAKHIARIWASIAIHRHAHGLDWHESAKNSHEALAYALLII